MIIHSFYQKAWNQFQNSLEEEASSLTNLPKKTTGKSLFFHLQKRPFKKKTTQRFGFVSDFGKIRNLRLATDTKKKHRRYGFSPWRSTDLAPKW